MRDVHAARPPDPRRGVFAFLGGVGLALALAGLGGGCRRAEPLDVLFLVSDTLRADAVTCDGKGADTPNLCALAARGTLFEQAYANAPWTLPSSVALLTGRDPSQFLAEETVDGETRYFLHVPDGVETLVETLGSRGYTTIATVENKVALRANAFQGFEQRGVGRAGAKRLRAELAPAIGTLRADRRWDQLLPTLEVLTRPPEGPLFLLHWIDDPHAAYSPPAAFLETLRSKAATLPRPLGYYLGLGHHHRPAKGLHNIRRVVDELGPEERSFLHELYRAEVASVDERVGILLDALERSGRAERTLVVFTSDHGEGFGEHGTWLHGQTLHEELLRVPLIVAGPGVAAGQRVATPVSGVDVVPTLRDLLGLEAPAETHGETLVDLLHGRSDRRRRVQFFDSPLRLEGDGAAVRKGDFKLIALAPEEGGDALYDLRNDPGERRNLAAERTEVVAALRAIVDARQRENRVLRARLLAGTDAATLHRAEEETRRQMEAVGYLD